MNNKKTVAIEINKKDNLWDIVIFDPIDFEKLSSMIEEKFFLNPTSGYLIDITGDIFKRYKNKNYKIKIGTGEWCQFVVLSEKPKSNQLIEEIYEWLQVIEIPT